MKYAYWDSNCFIGYLADEEYGRDARMGVIQAVERGELRLVTSAFTLVEVVKLKVKDGDVPPRMSSAQRASLEACFSPANGVVIVNVDVTTATKAREAVWDRGIDPKDAIHVGSALQFKESALSPDDELVFHTFDKKLIKRADGYEGVRFEELGGHPYQPDLDLG